MTHPISLSYLSLADVPPVKAIQVAADSGYDFIGMRLLPASETEPVPALLTEDALLRDVLAALDDTGLAVADVEMVRLTPEMRIADFEPMLERAARLRARHLSVAGDDPDDGRLVANFAALCRLADVYGLTVDLEPIPWMQVSRLADARWVVETAGEANGGVIVDPLHLDRAGSSFDEVAMFPGSMLHLVQFCDAAAPYALHKEGLIDVARGRRLVPGDGDLDLLSLARSIPAGVTVSVEVPNREWARTTPPGVRAARLLAVTRAVLEAARTSPVDKAGSAER